jgi:hypothetical protein
VLSAATVPSVSKRRRVDPGALRRDLRNHQRWQSHWRRDAFFVSAPFLVAIFEVVRVGTAPIRGTTAWFDGVLIGVGAGGVGAVIWWVLVVQRGVAARALAGVAAVALLLVLLTSSGGRGHAAPDVTSGYLAGAVTYDASVWETWGSCWCRYGMAVSRFLIARLGEAKITCPLLRLSARTRVSTRRPLQAVSTTKSASYRCRTWGRASSRP